MPHLPDSCASMPSQSSAPSWAPALFSQVAWTFILPSWQSCTFSMLSRVQHRIQPERKIVTMNSKGCQTSLCHKASQAVQSWVSSPSPGGSTRLIEAIMIHARLCRSSCSAPSSTLHSLPWSTEKVSVSVRPSLQSSWPVPTLSFPQSDWQPLMRSNQMDPSLPCLVLRRIKSWQLRQASPSTFYSASWRSTRSWAAPRSSQITRTACCRARGGPWVSILKTISNHLHAMTIQVKMARAITDRFEHTPRMPLLISKLIQKQSKVSNLDTIWSMFILLDQTNERTNKQARL